MIARDPLPTDPAALTTLLPRVLTVTVAVAIAFAAIRGASGSKTWDKAMFVVAVALVVLLCVDVLRRPPRRVGNEVISACAVIGLLIGITGIERPAFSTFLWEGFGSLVAVGAVCLAIFFWRWVDRGQASRPVRAVLTTVVSVVAVCDLASLVRTTSNIVDAPQNLYVFNEVLAPAAGRVPDATFLPQYATLLGWLLVPLRPFMSARTLVDFAVIFLSALGILAVVLGVVIAYRLLPSRSLWLAAGIVIPLTCVAVPHAANQYGSIGSYMQQLPVRLFPNMLFSWLGLEELARIRAGSVRRRHLPAIGVLAGLIVWNSQDFGIVAPIAYSAVLAVAVPGSARRSSLAGWAAGLVGGLAAYPLFGVCTGTPIKLGDFGLYSRAFGSGFDSALIQVPGPVLVVLPVLLASTAVGWCMLWRDRAVPPSPPPYDRAVLTLALVGTWATGGFLYYLNRSFGAEQLQILLLPCGVCIVALVALGREELARLVPSGEASPVSNRRVWLGLLPVALLGSLGLASMLLSPRPSTTFDALRSATTTSFDHELIPTRTIRTAEQYARVHGGSLGYIGNNGNYIHLTTGLPDVLLFDDPAQFTLSPAIRNAGCRFLSAHATTWLLASPTDDQSTAPVDTCGMYEPVDVPGIAHGLFYGRRA